MLQHVNAAGTTYAAPHVATLAGPLFACDIGIQRPPALVAALEHSDGRRRRSARRDALIYEAIGRHVWDDGYAVVALGKLAAALGIERRRVTESLARLKAAGLVVVVQKGHGGRGTSGRANVYKLPDFSAALDHMGKRRPTRPALAAPTAADYERAKQSASAHGGAHSKGCAAMRTESAPAPKQSALNHGGAPSSAENQAALNQASRVGTGLRERSKTRARGSGRHPLAARTARESRIHLVNWTRTGANGAASRAYLATYWPTYQHGPALEVVAAAARSIERAALSRVRRARCAGAASVRQVTGGRVGTPATQAPGGARLRSWTTERPRALHPGRND